jgi:hypothetical protein
MRYPLRPWHSLAGAALVLLAVAGARADTVLFNGVSWVNGSSAASATYDLYAPGTITVTLKDYKLPTALATLDLSLFESGATGAAPQFLGMVAGAGQSSLSESYKVGAGDLSTQLFASASGSSVGLYDLMVTYQPAQPVPLPTGIALLPAALLGLGLLARRRAAQSR